MGSLIEELQRREAAARQEVDELRGEIARLNDRLARAEERLSRLEITRETVTEILGGVGADQPAVAGGGHPRARWPRARCAPGLDNLATHKTPAIQQWLARHPRFRLHFTPTGSSWINQVPVNRPSARRHARTA